MITIGSLAVLYLEAVIFIGGFCRLGGLVLNWLPNCLGGYYLPPYTQNVCTTGIISRFSWTSCFDMLFTSQTHDFHATPSFLVVWIIDILIGGLGELVRLVRPPNREIDIDFDAWRGEPVRVREGEVLP